MTKNNVTFKEPSILPVWSKVTTQCEGREQWTYNILIALCDVNQNKHSNKVYLTKTGHIIIRNAKHVKTTTITAHQYM